MNIISPELTYDSFTFYLTGQVPIWTIPGPLSGDLVAGLIVAFRTILTGIRSVSNDGWIKLSMGSHTSELLLFGYSLEHYEAYSDKDHFGWQIEGIVSKGVYNLYSFASPEFIQGFISMCNAFNVDFRDYVSGLPFKTENNKLIHYDIKY